MTQDDFIRHIEKTKHGVSVEAFVWDDRETKATVVTYTHPDGSPTAKMNVDELRDVASMLDDVAEEMLLEDITREMDTEAER